MPDTKFKNANISFPGLNWATYSNGGKIGDDQYKPDRAFKDDADRDNNRGQTTINFA